VGKFAPRATAAFIDRLTLTQARIDAMADGGRGRCADIADPIRHRDRELATSERQWSSSAVRVPLGVGRRDFRKPPPMSRPDAGVLCWKSGNAVILRRGFPDSFSLLPGDPRLSGAGIAAMPICPKASITLVPTRDRSAVGLLLTDEPAASTSSCPRGGKSLVARVEAEARVPVFAAFSRRQPRLCRSCRQSRNGEVDRAERAKNAGGPGVCGAAETLLVDRKGASDQPQAPGRDADRRRCEVRGDGRRAARRSG